MKLSIWDILAIITLIAVLLIGIIFLQIFSNPYSSLNPFPPPTLPAAVVIPSPTSTQRSMPPTWTPEPGEVTPGAVEEAVGLLSTSTPFPTATGFTLPTFTPSNTFTVTPSITPTRTRDHADYIGQDPRDGITFSPGQDFDMAWTLKNAGFNTWNTSYRFRYASGERTYKKKMGDSMPLPYSVSPDDTIKLIVDMRAPQDKGDYRTTWELVNGAGEKIISVYLDFKVK
jgi:hypothetical protein